MPANTNLSQSLNRYPEMIHSQMLNVIGIADNPSQFAPGITRMTLLNKQIDYTLGGKVAELAFNTMAEMAKSKGEFHESVPDIRAKLQTMKVDDREAFRTHFIDNAVRPALIRYVLQNLNPPATQDELAPLREKEETFWDHLPLYLPNVKNIAALRTALDRTMNMALPTVEEAKQHASFLKEHAAFVSQKLNSSQQEARNSIMKAITQGFLAHTASETEAFPDLLSYGFTDASKKIVDDVLTRHKNIQDAYDKGFFAAENERDHFKVLLTQTLYPYAERQMRHQATDWFPDYPGIERFSENTPPRNDIRDAIAGELDIELGNNPSHRFIAAQLLDDIDRTIAKVMPTPRIAQDIIHNCLQPREAARSVA